MAKEKKKVPNLRFKGFTDDWEQRKLKDVVEKQIKGKAQFEKLAPGEVEYLDTSRLNGGQAILTNGLKDVTLDDILILWDGSKAGTVYHGFEGALGSTLKAYRTSANSKFVYQYLKRHQDNIYNNYRTPNIPHVQKDFLNVFTISVPVSDEQEKIGSFFQQLDNTIVLHQRKLDLLKQLKKGFLQKMFADKDSKQPVLRFKGFHDDWEQRKVSDIFTVTRGQVLATTKISEVKTNEMCFPVYSSQTKNNGLMGYYNKYLFNTAITWTTDGANAGTVNYREGKFYSTNVNGVLLSDDGYANKAIAEILDRVAWRHVSRVGNPKLMNNVMSNIKISIPSSFEEQNAISEFLIKFDHLIVLHQRKQNHLKLLKKSLLQQMFM